MSFVHLHCHSEYSLLDGANRVDDLIRRAQELEQPALAITDHGNLHAAWDFQEKAKKAKVKPIIGMEAYVAPGDRRQRGRTMDGAKPYYHLVLLARDAVGYRNLVKLSSLAFTEGFYTKPRVDRELLAQYHEGIIVSSACMAGEIATHLLADNFAGAREVAEWYADVFKDRYYLEVQAHTSEGQARLNERVFRLAKDTGLPVVATNDAHFLTRSDHDAHDVLLCIGLGKDRADRDRMRYDNGLYFKSKDEIAASFRDRPDVIENTLRIADDVDVAFEKKYFLPSFPLPAGVGTENDLLTTLATKGAEDRYGRPLPAHVRERLDYELGVITKTGYAGYFLIVSDFIAAARAKGIPVGPGRGSAAGSLVAYALRITDVDPLTFDLLFERFLNPERVSMPDVDVDFCFERRGEVIEYVREKYGRDSVCQIVTFGTMKSRAAIKDVGRVLGFTPAETDALAKLIPNQPNFSLTVSEAIEQIAEVKKLYSDDDRYRQLLDYAVALEGLSRHTGVHAAGVVIAPGPVSDYVPVCTQSSKGAGSSDDEQVVVSQYDMNCLEKAGMLKMDFLGLTTLTVIHDALTMITERRGETIDVDRIALEDEEVYRQLRAGRTVGVFQFESPLATDLLRGMRCDRFDDLVASNALMRPGPLDAGMHRVYQRRKKGEEAVTYALPELETILKPTYGVITYQEQVMRIAQVLAGISLAEADVLRKAVGKKDAELIRQELGKFVEKAVARGYDRRIIEELAGQIETFGRYGFNKSHSVAYSVISYQTAWLKTHYAPEFMAALLSSSIGDTDNVVKYIAEARELGLEVLAPDVNESGYKFTVVGDKRLRFGLGAIRNVGHSAIDSILKAREERPFTDLFDLCERVDLRLCNKRVFEALIASGALDSMGVERAQNWAALDTALHEASLRQAEKESGQVSLFGDMFSPVAGGPDAGSAAAEYATGAQGAAAANTHHAHRYPNVPAWSESERLSKEKEILGFYISGHPLEPYQLECELFASHQVAQLGSWTGDPMALGVVITAVKKQISKRSGSEFARLTIEDFSGSAEVLIFPEKWAMLGDRIKTDVPVLLKGGYSKRDRDAEMPTFIVESVTPFAELAFSGQIGVAITLGDGRDVNAEVLKDVRAVIETHSTSGTVAPALEVRFANGNGGTRLRSRSLRLPASHAALLELRALLGADRVHLVRAGQGA
ncbi:MAG TPA: DNA polymerase III subunit alpha [Gemmatimonadaceae bacterium]|nr:DNA polymerase III subunit alpha [Gemmatimonadaceae bacterium]